MAFKKYYLIFFSFFFFSIVLPYYYAGVGIDASWCESLALAIEHKLIFGKDFIFNYGPLGFLNTGILPKTISVYWIFIYHLFLVTNYLVVINKLFTEFSSQKLFIVILSITMIYPIGGFSDASFILFYFFLFWILNFQKTQSSISILYIILNLLLIFFIKLNLSFLSLGILIFSLAIISIENKLKTTKCFITLLLAFISIFVFSKILHTDLHGIFKASNQIIDAYQDSMAVQMSSSKEILFYLISTFIILFAFIFLILKHYKELKFNILAYFLILFSAFIAFKQGFTALANINITGFFSFLPPLAILLVLFIKNIPKNKLFNTLILVWMIKTLVIFSIGFNDYGRNLNAYFRSFFPKELSNQLKSPVTYAKIFALHNPVNYLNALKDYDFNNNFVNKELNDQRLFSNKIINKIENQTVDILPWEISYIYFNRLNYVHRPVIQSYQANSEWLVKQNENCYFGKNKPHFVLSQLKPFREQNLYWSDKGAYQSLKYNYQLTDTIYKKADTLFLFEKSQKPKLLTKVLIKQSKQDFSNKLMIPKSNEDIYLYADIKYSWIGKIARLFYQPFYLRCEVEYEHSKNASFRIPPSILKGGILINKRINYMTDFANYHLNKKNEPIKSIRFFSKYKIGFNDEFTYRMYVEK